MVSSVAGGVAAGRVLFGMLGMTESGFVITLESIRAFQLFINSLHGPPRRCKYGASPIKLVSSPMTLTVFLPPRPPLSPCVLSARVGGGGNLYGLTMTSNKVWSIGQMADPPFIKVAD